jgi:hypothetical protein
MRSMGGGMHFWRDGRWRTLAALFFRACRACGVRTTFRAAFHHGFATVLPSQFFHHRFTALRLWA